MWVVDPEGVPGVVVNKTSVPCVRVPSGFSSPVGIMNKSFTFF